jgi:dTDP-4-dehydrorhamnose reductase
MRFLILGGTGLIGSHLADECSHQRLPHLGTWCSTPHAEYAPLDVRDPESVNELIADYQPDVTFLAAGVSCPSYAEQFAGEYADVNVAGTATVARAVARHGGSLVLFSSDAIFGNCSTARREEDPLSPHGVLARGKADAEAVVRSVLPDRHLILRTGWVFGAGDRGFASRLASGERVVAATDRFGQPTFAGDLASAAIELSRLGRTGTFHAVGPEKHSEFTFARTVAHVFGYDTDLVEGLTANQIDDRDPRPLRVWLDRFKLRGVLGAKAFRTSADGLRMVRDVVFGTAATTLRAA